MNLGIFIVVLIFTYCLLPKKKTVLFSRLIVFTGLIQFSLPGTFISTSLRDFSFGEVFQFLSFVAILIYSKPSDQVNKKFLYSYFFFLLCVLFGLFSLIFFGPPTVPFPKFNQSLDELFYDRASPQLITFSSDHVIRIFRVLLLFPFLNILANKSFDKVEIEKLLVLSGLFIFSFVVGEFLLKIVGADFIYNSIYSIVLGFPPLTEERGSIPVLIGLTLEPSHLAYSLILPLIVFSYKNKYLFLFYFIISLMLISGSLRTSGFALFIIILHLGFKTKNKNGFNYIYLLLLFPGIIFLGYYLIPIDFLDYSIDRYLSLLNPFESEGSAGVRIFTWQYAFDALKIKPIFGIGLGSISIYSGLLAALASIGLLGFYAYIKLIISFTNIKINSFSVFGLFTLMLFSWNVNILYDVGIFLIFLLLAFFEEEKCFNPPLLKNSLF